MKHALKTIRVVLAALMLFGITALILDATDGAVLRHWLGWMPKIQILPALLALNVVVILGIMLVNFLIGRLYCSVVCPMGIFQDIFIWFHRIIFGKKRPYRYRKPQNWLRYTVLALFVILMVLGLNGIATLIAPYSAYARMVANIHGTGLVHWIAIATLCCIGVMSFMYGRLWCNTICPMGTLMGFVSGHSLFGIRIDSVKCVACGKCEKRCKANCINLEDKSVDGSRCVMCFNCLGHCKQGAITIAKKSGDTKKSKEAHPVDDSRRKFLTVTAAVGAATALHAQEQKFDGGLAAIADKQMPQRATPLKPAGSLSRKNFESHCTACQLCVSKCPEQVLRPTSCSPIWPSTRATAAPPAHVAARCAPQAPYVPSTKNRKRPYP